MRTWYSLLGLLVASIASAQGTITVSPKLDTLAVGSTVKITRTITPVWSSDNPLVATVNSTGTVTARTSGTANIRVTVGGVSATTVVVVPGPVAVPPPDSTPAPDTTPAPPPVAGSNEPAGMTPLTNRPFNVKNEQGWDDNGGSIIADATAPQSPPNILRTTLPAGFRPGGGTASGDFTFAAYRTVYVSYWARYSLNWQGGEAALDKQFYLYTSTGVPSLIFVASGQGSAAKRALLEGQDILAGGAGHGDAANPDWGPNQGANSEMVRGQWFHVEAVLVGNTSGNADGTVTVFLNGAKVISYGGIKFISGAAKWSWFHYTNIWTGGSGSVPAAQNQDFDGIYISAK